MISEIDESEKVEGAQIYAQKPNLGAEGITWSQENYGHLGLQVESRGGRRVG